MNKVKRPILRYHGGKWVLAPWIISHFPKHKIYVEPYGGAASVLLRKKRSYGEVYNELDSEITNLFKVIRANGNELKNNLQATPFSREEFELSYIQSDDDIEQARRTVVRSFMGFGSASSSKRRTGFRSNSNRSGTTPAHDWANYPSALDQIIKRLSGVVIESKNALDVIRSQDSEDTLFYVDPPYVHTTRYAGANGNTYLYEMSEQDHIDLAKVLNNLKGVVVLSGYDCELYNELYSKWNTSQKDTYADGARKRVETIWMNRPIKSQISLF